MRDVRKMCTGNMFHFRLQFFSEILLAPVNIYCVKCVLPSRRVQIKTSHFTYTKMPLVLVFVSTAMSLQNLAEFINLTAY